MHGSISSTCISSKLQLGTLCAKYAPSQSIYCLARSSLAAWRTERPSAWKGWSNLQLSLASMRHQRTYHTKPHQPAKFMGKRFQRAYIHVILEFLTRFFPFTKMTFSSTIEPAVQCHCLMMSAKTRHIKHDRSIFQKNIRYFWRVTFLIYGQSPCMPITQKWRCCGPFLESTLVGTWLAEGHQES